MRAIILGTIAGTLAGVMMQACTGDAVELVDKEPSLQLVHVPNGRDAYIKTVTVDGTRCVVLTGYRGNALSCDWQAPE